MAESEDFWNKKKTKQNKSFYQEILREKEVLNVFQQSDTNKMTDDDDDDDDDDDS